MQHLVIKQKRYLCPSQQQSDTFTKWVVYIWQTDGCHICFQSKIKPTRKELVENC